MVDDFSQGYLFFIFILVGISIGILFDIFRILRKTFKTSDFVTYIQDILFWILSGMLLIYSIFIFNNGELRSYIFLGIFIGIIIYMLTISKYFIKLNVMILNIIKKVFNCTFKVILWPFKLIFIKPLNILKCKIKQLISKYTTFIHKMNIRKKKIQKV